jgi:ribonuclease HII
MGYLTEEHEQALREKGLTPLHRRSVKKVQAIFETRAARGNL